MVATITTSTDSNGISILTCSYCCNTD